jgi:hypothetical protein
MHLVSEIATFFEQVADKLFTGFNLLDTTNLA